MVGPAAGPDERNLLDFTFRMSKQPLVEPAGLLIMDPAPTAAASLSSPVIIFIYYFPQTGAEPQLFLRFIRDETQKFQCETSERHLLPPPSSSSSIKKSQICPLVQGTRGLVQGTSGREPAAWCRQGVLQQPVRKVRGEQTWSERAAVRGGATTIWFMIIRLNISCECASAERARCDFVPRSPLWEYLWEVSGGRLEGGELHFLHPLGFLHQTQPWRH